MQFIPFEDDWDALARLRPEDLVPYRVGMLDSIDRQSQDAASSTPALSSLPLAMGMPGKRQ